MAFNEVKVKTHFKLRLGEDILVQQLVESIVCFQHKLGCRMVQIGGWVG